MYGLRSRVRHRIRVACRWQSMVLCPKSVALERGPMMAVPSSESRGTMVFALGSRSERVGMRPANCSSATQLSDERRSWMRTCATCS